jgi:adenylate cyclase
MALETSADSHLEIAHVLFIDIVAYSQLPINQQTELVKELNERVRATEEFRAADTAGKLIRLATGDGMALAFFTSPDAPLRCALQLSDAVRESPRLQLRMGIHSGPIEKLADVNERSNVAGAGINTAQRVMDCADAGHILLSRRVADDLAQYDKWQPHLHNLGQVEVKHGARMDIVNFYTGSVGNAAVPRKIAEAKKRASRRAKLRVFFGILTLVGVIVAAVFFFFQRARSRDKSATLNSDAARASEKSIAVLPFVDLSQTKDQEYFCDGMSEEILNALAKIEELRVVARTSSFAFKGKTADVSEVGKKLNVKNVLEGSLRREGSRIRITAQLVNVSNGFQIWSESYDRELEGVFALQDEITRSIVEALKLKLALSPPPHQPPNMEAYDLYLQGLYLSNKSSEEDLRKALSLFECALEKDSTLARAWTGIAKVWFFLADVYVKPLEAYPASRAAALKAIALDEKEAEAHCYLGEAKRILDWDLSGEDEELKLALQLDPNSAQVHLFLALLPLFRGDLKEGLRLVLEAEQLDPLSPIISYVATAAYLADNRIDEAIIEGQRTQQLDPHYFYLDSNLAAAYREKGNFSEAIALYTKVQEERRFPSSGLAITYARMNQQSETRKILQQLLEQRQTRYVSAQTIAAIYVALGEKEEAFRWLDRAAADHSGTLQWIAFLPEFGALRPDARFSPFLRRIGVSHSSVLSITETTLVETKDPNAQAHFTLKVGVKPRPNTPNGHVVRLSVSFYDRTKDNKMKPTNARTGYDWLTPADNWSDGAPKFLGATYVRPKTEAASPDGSQYGGFIVRVYFDGQLQDARAKPPELLTLFPAPDQLAPAAAAPSAHP